MKAALLKAGFTSAQVKANRTRVLEAATVIYVQFGCILILIVFALYSGHPKMRTVH